MKYYQSVLARGIAISLAAGTLVACNESANDRAPRLDLEVDPLVFTSVTVPQLTVSESNVQTISGLSAYDPLGAVLSVPVTITSCEVVGEPDAFLASNTCQFKIIKVDADGVESSSVEPFVNNGDKLSISITASEQGETAIKASIAIGKMQSEFIVTTAPDSLPDEFTIAPLVGQEWNSSVTSEAISFTGLSANALVPIALEACSDCRYTVIRAGKEAIPVPDHLLPSDQITVTLLSANASNASTSATLKLGSDETGFVQADFVVTTLDKDVDDFAFTPTSTDDPSKGDVISTPYTVTGLSTGVDVAISSQGTTCTTAPCFTVTRDGSVLDNPATVSNGDEVRAVVTPDPTDGGIAITRVQIGDQSADFVVTTESAKGGSEATLLFPPLSSFTGDLDVQVRVKAIKTADLPVTGVTITNTTTNTPYAASYNAASDSWVATGVVLQADSVNEFSLVSSDAKEQSAPVTFTVTQGAVTNGFPMASNGINRITSMSYDAENQKLYSGDINGTLFATSLVDNSTQAVYNLRSEGERLFGVFYDKANSRVLSGSDKGLYAYATSDWTKTTLIDKTTAGAGVLRNLELVGATLYIADMVTSNTAYTSAKMLEMDYPTPAQVAAVKRTNVKMYGLDYDEANARLVSLSIVPLDADKNVVSTVAMTDTTAATRVCDFANTETTNKQGQIQLIPGQNKALAVSQDDKIYLIDLATNDCSGQLQDADTVNPLNQLEAIVTDPSLGFAIVADTTTIDGILAVDLVSGERVYISKKAH